MNHRGTVELETDRLILRRFVYEDAGAMYTNWAHDPEVTKYLRWYAHSSLEATRSVVHQWIGGYMRMDNYLWAIVPRDVGEPIGSISVVKYDTSTSMVHVGYCIGQQWWNQGYTSEALIRLVRFFFEDVGVNRIEALHDPRNPNSGKVMMKAGMVFEGTMRQADWNNLGICDASIYAILAQDYREARSARD